ncbi:MAG: hypothetical protein IPL92_11765 [Saprospiraceae bacterium]|nr:hypothetical protein [Candidatus Opimibacter iunctus]
MNNLFSRLLLLSVAFILNCSSSFGPLVIEYRNLKIEFSNLDDNDYSFVNSPDRGEFVYENKRQNIGLLAVYYPIDHCMSDYKDFDVLLSLQKNLNEENNVLVFHLNSTYEADLIKEEIIKVYPLDATDKPNFHRIEYWYSECRSDNRVFINFNYKSENFDLMRILTEIKDFRSFKIERA